MLLRPPSIASQQLGLQTLSQVVNQYPICEAFIDFLATLAPYWNQFSPQGFQTIYQVVLQAGKVLRYIEENATASIPVYQYLGTLIQAAMIVATSANLASVSASGTLTVTLSSSATGALTTLQLWDDVLGTNQPPMETIGQLGSTLITSTVGGA